MEWMLHDFYSFKGVIFSFYYYYYECFVNFSRNVFIMFWPMLEKLLNIEQIFSLKIHLNQN
jgi:hypothetical protein